MPLIPIILVLLLLVALVISTPFLLYLRYRTGTMRRRGRKWAANINLASLALSVVLLVWVAALTTFWVPRAFSYSFVGLFAGSLLGLLGLASTRWEMTSRELHYTPNRWLILLLTLAVVTRLLYGLWRIWHAWHTTARDASWLASAGVAGSMAVGAVVVGYYFVYFAGVRWKLRTQPRTRN